jgi:hypothetical protein
LPEPEGPSRATTSPADTSIVIPPEHLDALAALVEHLGDPGDGKSPRPSAGPRPWTLRLVEFKGPSIRRTKAAPKMPDETTA